MVVFSLVAQNNGQTFHFDEPIPKVHFMKLLSCSLCNSWNTLKNEGSASLGDEKKKTLCLFLNYFPGIITFRV